MLRELEACGITKLRDMIALEGNANLNLSWNQLIKLVNFNAQEKILSMKSTFGEVLDAIPRFLV